MWCFATKEFNERSLDALNYQINQGDTLLNQASFSHCSTISCEPASKFDSSGLNAQDFCFWDTVVGQSL